MQSSAQEEDRLPLEPSHCGDRFTVVAVLAAIALLATLFFVFMCAAAAARLCTGDAADDHRETRDFYSDFTAACHAAASDGRAPRSSTRKSSQMVMSRPMAGWRRPAPAGPVAAGLPILAGQSSDLLQAESDLVNRQCPVQAGAGERGRASTSFFDSEGAAQKDWQQSQFDLANAAAALASARNRLRLMGKTDGAGRGA